MNQSRPAANLSLFNCATRYLSATAAAVGLAMATSAGFAAVPAQLDLHGAWRLRLDPSDAGISDNWAGAPLQTAESLTLPTTTDLAGFGFALDTNTLLHAAPFPVTTRFPGVKEPSRADEHGYLVRRHLYVGRAWYEREVTIPESWKGYPVTLSIERALWHTEVWVDGRKASSADSLVAAHSHDLGVLRPGKHRLTVCVDNRMIHNISTVTHAYGPETQSRWNGIIGAITLEPVTPVTVRSLTTYPAPDRRSVRVAVRWGNGSGPKASTRVRLRLFPEQGDTALAESASSYPSATDSAEITLHLDQPAAAWDEFHPVRYRAEVTLENAAGERSTATVKFGFRHVERAGQSLHLNGRPIFLRGTLDCAVYPRTGHPPMSVAEWERELGIIKEYGFNHVRFHTWCPPAAAFEAADRLGLYLQPETAAWVDDWGTQTVTKPAPIGRDPQVTEFLRAELRRMSEAYGNHPSFLLCAIGNEFGTQSTEWDRVNGMVQEIKPFDPRRVYAGCGARKNLPADDFWFTHNSGAATRGVGPAHTDWDFAKALATSPVPLIAHETGQRPVFPDYPAFLPKFTGPLLPLNFTRYQRALDANGLTPQLPDFVRASARFQLTQYKAEHEAMLRTRGYTGYQLLMLNDFTGQSEALVGILDPFRETKGHVSAAEVRAWNAPTVLLARFARFVWSANETFQTKLEVAHFGPGDLPAQSLRWSLIRCDGVEFAAGSNPVGIVESGQVTDLATLSIPLARATEPVALVFRVRLGNVTNEWPLWVYPESAAEPPPSGVLVSRVLDEAAVQALRGGGKVLLLAHGLKNPHTARTGFESVYWSAGWWGNRFSSLGILCDPAHPALKEFPNAGWSDWQWRDLCAGATTFDLTGAPAGFRPIVQPVPDFHFNTLLAQVFEAKVGPGSLLVCGYDLESNLEQRLAARQFRRSLYRYLASDAFRPVAGLPLAFIEARCRASGLAARGAKVANTSSEDRANGNVAANILDGDPATIWHTRWQPQADLPPHELTVDLGREVTLAGLVLTPRQDQSNGRSAQAEIFASSRADDWGQPVAQWHGQDTNDVAQLRFPAVVKARFIRLVFLRSVNGQPFAALADLDVIPAAQTN